MDKSRCGECDACIDHELRHLARIEAVLWKQADGDLTEYLHLMATWQDLFVRGGLPRR